MTQLDALTTAELRQLARDLVHHPLRIRFCRHWHHKDGYIVIDARRNVVLTEEALDEAALRAYLLEYLCSSQKAAQIARYR